MLARVGLAAAIALSAVLAMTAPASADRGRAGDGPSANPDLVRRGAGCVTLDKATYTHTFQVDQSTHTATATISLRKALCGDAKQAFTLVSYLAPAKSFAVPQYAFDSRTIVLDKDTITETLTIDVPQCFTQVDFFFGDKVITPLTEQGDRYGNTKVGSKDGIGATSQPAQGSQREAWYNGGDGVCETAPKVEATSDCDGSMTLNLRNGANATATDYVIASKDGKYRTEVEVPRSNPVAQVKVSANNAKDLIVTSGGKQIGEFGWTRPEDCTAPTITTSSDCSASSVTIANPAANTPVEATILVTGQSEAKTLTIGNGTSETVEFAAGVKVSVTVFGTTTLFDLKKPDSCDSSGTLPVTGTNAALIAGAAILLVAAGTGLFLTARRRRVTFTA